MYLLFCAFFKHLCSQAVNTWRVFDQIIIRLGCQTSLLTIVWKLKNENEMIKRKGVT